MAEQYFESGRIEIIKVLEQIESDKKKGDLKKVKNLKDEFKKCGSPEDFRRTVRQTHQLQKEFWEEIVSRVPEEGKHALFGNFSLDERKLSSREHQNLDKSGSSSGKATGFGKTYVNKEGSKHFSEASGTSDQTVLAEDEVQKKYPTADWKKQIQELKKCLADKEKTVQDQERKLQELKAIKQADATKPSAQVDASGPKYVQSSHQAKVQKQNQDKSSSAAEERKQSPAPMTDSSKPKWNNFLEKLEEHLNIRDRAMNDYENEAKQLQIRCERSIDEASERANINEVNGNKLFEQVMHVTAERDNCKDENTKLETEIANMRKKYGILQSENNNLKSDVGHLTANLVKAKEDLHRRIQSQKDEFENERRIFQTQMMEMKKDRDDIRDRFSKVAGQKLVEKNADIADLSDPNRAMKLSEKFGQIYDDSWTDAFEALCGKKVKPRDAIQQLLQIMKVCQEVCENTAVQQIEDLTEVLLRPIKTVGEVSKTHAGMKGKPRLGSKNEKVLRDARRQMWEASVDTIRQAILEKTKGFWEKSTDVKTYTEKCVDITWLMTIHDPPVYMKMDTKDGEKLDQNLYTAYSSSGDKIDFLVWPPLFNGKDGGLLSKGVAEPLRIVKKDKK